MIEEMIQQYQELEKEFEALEQKFREDFLDRIKPLFNKFFDENEEIGAICWTQFTPYFNDGDECVFSVKDVYFTNLSNLEQIETSGLIRYGEIDRSDIQDESIWVISAYSLRYAIKKHNKGDSVPKYYFGWDRIKNPDVVIKFSELLESNTMKNVLKSLFGDHVSVIVTRDGITVEEYDHE